MHRHVKPQQWALAFGDPADCHGEQLLVCPDCSVARGDLQAWLLTLAECPRCWAAFQAYDPLPPDVLECEECMTSYQEFERWVDRVEHFEPLVVREWHAADEQLEELAHGPESSRIERVESDESFHRWGVCQRLLVESRAHWTKNLHHAHSTARLAAAVADRLDEDEYHPRWVADLRAKARGYLANTHRLLGDYAAAETEFAAAERWVEQGVRQGRAEATVLSLKSSLLLDQYRHLEAEALLERVVRHFRDHDQAHEAGRALLQLGMVSRARDRLPQAVQRVEEALSLLDPRRDPDLLLGARGNLVLYRIDAEDAEGARAAFEQLPEPRDHLPRLRRAWLEADLLRLEGDLDGAARLYDDVRIAYLAEEVHYNVALVSLDLAVVATAQGRTDYVRELARDAVVLLTRSGAPQEAFAALRLLVDSLEREAVSVAFIRRVGRKLSRLQPSS